MFRFFRFRLFRRPQIATFAEHERLTEQVVELLRMPVEAELCAPEPAETVAQPAAVTLEHAPPRPDSVAA